MERLIAFADWLGSTSLSALLTGHAWIVPNLQVVHIVAIAAVVIGAVLINLRALGLFDRERPLVEYLDRFLPVLGAAVVVLAISGFLLIASEPGRALFRTVFWIKLALIAAAFAFTWAQRPLLARADLAAVARPALALLSLTAWTGVIFAGRWIAYADAWPGAPA
jgi:hypothetical protein